MILAFIATSGISALLVAGYFKDPDFALIQFKPSEIKIHHCPPVEPVTTAVNPSTDGTRPLFAARPFGLRNEIPTDRHWDAYGNITSNIFDESVQRVCSSAWEPALEEGEEVLMFEWDSGRWLMSKAHNLEGETEAGLSGVVVSAPEFQPHCQFLPGAYEDEKETAYSVRFWRRRWKALWVRNGSGVPDCPLKILWLPAPVVPEATTEKYYYMGTAPQVTALPFDIKSLAQRSICSMAPLPPAGSGLKLLPSRPLFAHSPFTTSSATTTMSSPRTLNYAPFVPSFSPASHACVSSAMDDLVCRFASLSPTKSRREDEDDGNDNDTRSPKHVKVAPASCPLRVPYSSLKVLVRRRRVKSIARASPVSAAAPPPAPPGPVHIIFHATKEERANKADWNARCDATHSELSEHAPPRGLVTVSIPEMWKEYMARMRWNAFCDAARSDLSPHTPTVAAPASAAPPAAAPGPAPAPTPAPVPAVPVTAPASPSSATKDKDAPAPAPRSLLERLSSSPVPMSAKAKGKQRADPSSSRTPLKEVTGAAVNIKGKRKTKHLADKDKTAVDKSKTLGASASTSKSEKSAGGKNTSNGREKSSRKNGQARSREVLAVDTSVWMFCLPVLAAWVRCLNSDLVLGIASTMSRGSVGLSIYVPGMDVARLLRRDTVEVPRCRYAGMDGACLLRLGVASTRFRRSVGLSIYRAWTCLLARMVVDTLA
ncbi:hypothetical protein C8R43DRAFT_965427 [Mycena crocata]|nr:hypothetical protein C8R43DRAFT_965427 [Mycena crocata]